MTFYLIKITEWIVDADTAHKYIPKKNQQMPNKWCLNSGFKGINCIIKLSTIIWMVVATFEQTNGERNNYQCPYVHIYKFTIIRELRIRDAEYMMIDGVDETKITRKKNIKWEKKWATTWCWFYPIILISIVFRCRKREKSVSPSSLWSLQSQSKLAASTILQPIWVCERERA